MKRYLMRVLLGLLFCLPGLASAQETGVIQGVVVEAASNEPIPGANVILQEAGIGAATDLDGTYEITAPPGQYNLVVSFIGFKQYRTEIILEAGEIVEENIELQEDYLGLEEVVVTGQGAAIEKRRLSTTIEVVTPQQIEQTPSTRLEDLLQAQLPGAQIRFSSGQPGTSSLIRSRGVISANSSTTPVIYVDGVRVDNLNTTSALGLDTGGAQSSAIPDIPVENIERIEFIKGGAATTLYGSDAANGVIQIFTKKGLPGRTSLTYETDVGAMVGTADFLRFERTADVLYRPGLIQQHRLSGTAGLGKINFSFAGSMYEDNGFRYGNESVQYGLRTTVSGQVSPITRYTGTFGFSSNLYERDYNANTSWAQFGNLEGGSYGYIDTLSTEAFEETAEYVRDAVDLVDIQGDTKRFQTSQILELQPTKRLTTKITAGIDYRVNVEGNVGSPAFLSFIGSDPLGSFIENSERRFLGLTLEGTLQHQADVGDFSFISTAGGQVFRNEDRQTYVSAQNIAEGTASINNAAEQSAEDYDLVVANYGAYVLENIGFQDRFFVDLGLRADANSAFGEEVGVVLYPKVGAAYSLSSEPFFQRFEQDFLTNLKLRASLGYAGNFPTPFANDRLVFAAPYLGEIAYTYGQFGDIDLRPEKVRTFEVGADLGLFKDRVALEVTYYDALTQDALFQVPFAPSSGRSAQLFNVGEIANSGLELSSNFYLVDNPMWDLRLGASFNTLNNEVVDNGGTAPFSVGGFVFLGQWVEEGYPVGYLRGANPTFDAEGRVVVSDIERNAYLGSPLPDAYGNLTLSASWRNRLRFLAVADYQWGGQGIAMDDVLRFFRGLQDPERFPNPNDAELPPAVQQFYAGEISYTDLAGAWVEDTDYLKVRLLSFTYELPANWVAPAGVEEVAVGLRVNNPFNFTSSTFDPEVTGSNAPGQNDVNVGVFAYGTESPPRQYLFHMKVQF